jgi:hypothetical protein
MTTRMPLFLAVVCVSVLCDAQTKIRRATDVWGQPIKIKTIQDTVGTPTSTTSDGQHSSLPKVAVAAPKSPAANIKISNVSVTMGHVQETDKPPPNADGMLSVTFDASFRPTEARCRQPSFSLKGQVQHADTTRALLSGPYGLQVASPYTSTLPADAVVDASVIPATSTVTLKVPVQLSDRVLYIAILNVDRQTYRSTPVWEKGRELRDDEPAGQPPR